MTSMLAAQISALRAGLVFAQDTDDLFVRESCSLHYPSSSWGGL